MLLSQILPSNKEHVTVGRFGCFGRKYTRSTSSIETFLWLCYELFNENLRHMSLRFQTRLPTIPIAYKNSSLRFTGIFHLGMQLVLKIPVNGLILIPIHEVHGWSALFCHNAARNYTESWASMFFPKLYSSLVENLHSRKIQNISDNSKTCKCIIKGLSVEHFYKDFSLQRLCKVWFTALPKW